MRNVLSDAESREELDEAWKKIMWWSYGPSCVEE